MVLFVLLLMSALFLYLVVDYAITTRKDRMRERLWADSGEPPTADFSLWTDASDLMRVNEIRELLYSSPLSRKFDLMIKRAALPITLPQALLAFVAVALVPAVLAYIYWGSAMVFIGGLLAVPLLLWFLLTMLSHRRQKRHDAQLPAVIQSLLTTIRSGGTPIQALQSVIRNSPPPISLSMAEVLNSIQLGLAPNQAWKDWAEFWDTRATRLLATGIRLKWEAGGQMSAILQHILETLEFNRKMELRISTLTALAKLSAWVLSALPLVLALLTYIYRPDLFRVMITDPLGLKLLWSAAGLNILGLIALQRIARLKT